ncbi:phosphate signaling complex protein PhoU [Corynebacterium urogenitale]
MRSAYREQMNKFTHDLLIMSDLVRASMESASKALLEADLGVAEEIVSSIDTMEELRSKCESAAFELLALEGPVASDLRQVVSGIYIVEDLARMAALSVHVANLARRRHPQHVVPAEVRPFIEEMSSQAIGTAAKIKDVLVTADVNRALEVADDDDAVDDLHRHLFTLTTQRDWPHATRAAVDITLLSRYLERYSDHAVSIASRVVYMATGMHPDEYQQAKRTKEQQARFETQFDEISRRYGEIWD